MGRSRVNPDGTVSPRKLSARNQRKLAHNQHEPNPKRVVTSPRDRFGTPVSVKGQSLAQGPNPLIAFHKQLSDKAAVDALNTIAHMQDWNLARTECETARQQLLALVAAGPRDTSASLGTLQFDIEQQTPRSLRPASCNLRTKYFNELILRYAPIRR